MYIYIYSTGKRWEYRRIAGCAERIYPKQAEQEHPIVAGI